MPFTSCNVTSNVRAAASALVDRWYVYVDDQMRPWSVRLPAWIGEHPDLGFTHIAGPAPDPAPARLRLRRVALTDVESGRTWAAPVGHPAALVLSQPGASIVTPYRGRTRRLICTAALPEAQVTRARAGVRRGGSRHSSRQVGPTSAGDPSPAPVA